MYRLFPLSHAGIDAISDVNIPSDVPNNPMQDYEGAIPNHTVLSNSEANSPDRHCKMSQAIAKSVRVAFYCKETCITCPQGSSDNQMEADLFHDSHLKLQECMRNPGACHAEMMSDIMYYHQAIKPHDEGVFAKDIVNEVLVRREQITPDTAILQAIQAMHCKQNLMNNKIKSHKAWLKILGGKQFTAPTTMKPMPQL